MKPLLLRLAAFGSFPGTEEIDFTALAPRGLFVVSGPTGAGKTTVFDAMCWALYGKMPLKESASVRSDHAAADAPTFVELTFECEGERYVVTRRPTQPRAAKKGSGTVEDKGTAQLVRLDGAEATTALATNLTEVNSRCAALVGLDAEQFQRVVLLPQGEFSKFLLAKVPEREDLLGTLFGGAVFDRIVEELKAQARALDSEVDAADIAIGAKIDLARAQIARMHHQLGMIPDEDPTAEPDGADAGDARDDLAVADRAALGVALSATVAPLAEIEAQVVALAGAAKDATEAQVEASTGAERFDQAAARRSLLADLHAAQAAVDAGVVAARASSQARPVVAADEAAATAAARATGASTDRDRALDDVRQGFAAVGIEADLSSVTVISEALRSRQALHAIRVEALRALDAAHAAHDAAAKGGAALDARIRAHEEQVAATSARITVIEAALPAAREVAVDLDALGTRIDTARAHVTERARLDDLLVTLTEASERETIAARAAEAALARFVTTQAPRLASALVEGHPCPVCGSADHPAPARDHDGATVTYEQVGLARDAKDLAAQVTSTLHTKVGECRATLGDAADRTPEELAARVDACTTELAAARAAHEQLTALEADHAATAAKGHELHTEFALLQAERLAALDTIAERSAALEAAKLGATGLDPAELTHEGIALDALAIACAGLEDRFTTAATTAAEADRSAKALAAALATSPFAAVPAAHAALLDLTEEERLHEVATTHATRLAETTGAIESLEGLGIPTVRPDVAAAIASAEAASADHTRRATTATTARNAHADASIALEEHDQLVASSDELRTRHRLAQRAHHVCHRGGALGMPLKRWVLGRELDRVSAAANVHLARMTGDRYQLRRGLESSDDRKAFGLDLEVLDAQTGRPRSTSSLSGGEQFQASLALALGLADVVSHGGAASGRRFEALFVDEGFGSLDPEALDDAITALHQLHATGRMVGAITHVEAMKQQLHVGIEVTRRTDGSGSTLTVHP